MNKSPGCGELEVVRCGWLGPETALVDYFIAGRRLRSACGIGRVQKVGSTKQSLVEMWRSYGWRSKAEDSGMTVEDDTFVSAFTFIPACSRRGQLRTHCGGGKARTFRLVHTRE